MTWQLATKALHAAGGGPIKRMDFWPPTINGQDKGSSLTRAARLGMMERGNKGYVWRWVLTPLAATGAMGAFLDPTAKPLPKIDRDSVLRRLTVGVDQAIADYHSLTEKQRDVMIYIANGLTSKEIAALLGIQPKTVERHRIRLFSRLGFKKATEVAALAAKAGLV